MFLVVGATGYLGGMITRSLLSQARPTRILAREGSNFQPLVQAGAQAALGSLQDYASLQAACQGVRTIIATAGTQTLDYNEAIQARDVLGYHNLIAAAQAAGVEHFIFMSALGADPHSPIPYLAAKGQIEASLCDGRMAYTILQPSYFMEFWFMGMVLGPAANGQPVWVLGDGSDPHSPVAARDVAEFALKAIDYPAARNQILPVVGPQPLSLREAALTAEHILGKPVLVKPFDPATPPPELSPLAVQLMGLGPGADLPKCAITAADLGIRLTSLDEYLRTALAATPA